MNTAAFHACAMPSAIASNAQGRATVTLVDGRCVELDAFRDSCRDRAQELRRQAMTDFTDALAAALRRLSGALWRAVGPAPAPKAGVRVHGA